MSRRLLTLTILLLLTGVSLGAEKRSANCWRPVPIPDTWKDPPRESSDGFAWYRCWVRVPDSWRERTFELFVESADDARQSYVNGVWIGAAGTMPPRYRSGLGEFGRYAIPADLVHFGKHNMVTIRVYDDGGRSNFALAPPVLLAGAEGIRLEGDWQYRPGDDSEWARESSPNAEATFSNVERVDDVDAFVRRRRGDRDPLSPIQAVKAFQVAPDLKIEIALSEPHVRQPLFLSFDERGRLWVLEYLQYPDPTGLEAISRDKYLRTVYDKVPAPPPRHVRGRDRISIHEDSDGDGVYDRHTTFVDGLNIATSFARGRGGVFVLNPPYLLFYADGDNDDIPDGDPEVLLEGFGLEDTHSVVSNLRWGPDGWLYAAQGSTVTGNVKRPGDALARRSMGQLIWRYHPERRRYEVFAEGGGNTFDVEIDAKGRVYSGTNGGNARGFHYVQGGYSWKGFGKHGALSNPYAFGYFETMRHNTAARFTHGFVIYESSALPEGFHGKLLGIEPLQGQIVEAEIRALGSTFETKDVSRPVTTDDPWFRPVDITDGPDGALYIADFYEQRIDHASHYAGRIDRQSGRVYRVSAKSSASSALFDFAAFSSEQLVAMLREPNRWTRQTALRVLADRRDRSTIPILRRMLHEEAGQAALEALWALHAARGLGEDVVASLLDHADPYVRLWTVRLACDDGVVSPGIGERLAHLASIENHIEVRSQVAASGRRLPGPAALKLARALLACDDEGAARDTGDLHFPLLIWWLIESKSASHPGLVVQLFSDPALWDAPVVKQHIVERLMRRYAAGGRLAELLVCGKLLRLAPTREHVDLLMAGFEKAFEGRSIPSLPPVVARAIADTGGGSLALRLRQGSASARAEALRLVADDAAPIKERRRYIEVLGEAPQDAAVESLLGIARSSSHDELRIAALIALQAYGDARVVGEVLRICEESPSVVQHAASTLLASRKQSALSLARAVDEGKIDRSMLRLQTVRRMLYHGDATIERLVEKHWGSVDEATSAEVRQRIEQLTGVIDAASGNPYKGVALYRQRCGRCHTLFGDGGDVGPDLTGHKRDDFQRMLQSIVSPSAEIREGYENYLLITQDGRAVSGFLADQDDRVIVVRSLEGQSVVVQRRDVIDLRVLEQSVMPSETLKGLSDQQIRDLFAYLRSTQPLP